MGPPPGGQIPRTRTPAAKESEWRPKLRKMISVIKQFFRHWHINHLAPIPFIALYMLLGAIFFWWVEKDAELEAIAKKRELFMAIRADYIADIESVIGDSASGVRSRLRDRERGDRLARLVDALLARLALLTDAATEQQQPQQPQWTFMAAMYFSGTLFTTIGYGDIACETTVGRIGTVIYSVIGIPLTLITLNELGKFLYKCINEFMAAVTKKWRYFCCCVRVLGKGRRRFSRAPKYSQEPMTPTQKQAHKELERKTTHFFKDQRIAQRELVFDYDLKSLYGERKASSLESVVVPGEDVDLERGTLLARETSKQTSKKEERPQQQQQLGILGDEAPRMHVLVAIFFTVSWLFFCAALFKHVEDWTYGQSLYFVCISLLTVGLGDVKVSRREYMVLFFAFVMIGLSLVSMCINVIQNSIEDFYKRLLLQMLEKGDPNSLRNNRLAKFLLPLLSKEKKETMMRKMQDEAQRSGIDLGDFDQIFRKEGMVSRRGSTHTFESSQQPPSEPTPPSPAPEIVVELEQHIADEVDVIKEHKKYSLMVPFNWKDGRRESFQLEPKMMKLLPYIDKKLKPEEEERLSKLELRPVNNNNLPNGTEDNNNSVEEDEEGEDEGETEEGDTDA